MGWVFRVDDDVRIVRGTAVVRGKVITLPVKQDARGRAWYTVLVDGRGLLVEAGQLQKVEDGAGS